MELKHAFMKVLGEGVNMALATSVEGSPNVRVVTFGFDAAQPDKLFFSTFKGNRKIREFEQNPRVACMPLPVDPTEDIQVRIFGKVQKSALTLLELIALIGKKAPSGAETLTQGADQMEVYEVSFDDAWVTICMGEAQKYSVAE